MQSGGGEDIAPNTRIVHVTTVHRPFDGRIFHKQAVSLAEAGYDVFLVQVAEIEEVVSGVRVLPLRRPRNRYERMTLTALEAFRRALSVPSAICHLHDPELIPVGLFLKLCGRKVIYDVHEELTLFAYRAYLPDILRRPAAVLVRGFEKLAELAFDQIIAATPQLAEHFSPKKTTVVRNTPRAEELADLGPSMEERPPNAFFAGGLSPINGVDLMLHAMAALPPDSPVRLTLGGSFTSESEQARLLSKPGSDRVDYRGWMNREILARSMSEARVGLVLYRLEPVVLASDPIKLYEMMGAGLPLVTSDVPRWRALLRPPERGLMVDPQDARACAEAISWIIDHSQEAAEMGARARKAILDEHQWAIDEQRLLGVYRRLSRGSRQAQA